MQEKQTILFQDLGVKDYQSTWDYQENLLQENLSIKGLRRQKNDAGEPIADLPDTQHHLLFVEHPHVYTLGKSGEIEHVLISETERAKRGIEFFKINRGGDITYHGPQQIVGYPILDLEKYTTDIGKYLRNIEEVIIKTMADYGLEGDRSPGETGVWLDPHRKGYERKICAIGIRCSRWVTMHGFAFNVNTDLDYFNFIVPCGIQNKQVTSLEKELGRKLDYEEVKAKVKYHFENIFQADLVPKNL
jgi:lipoyl(octanoyl) transferase